MSYALLTLLIITIFLLVYILNVQLKQQKWIKQTILDFTNEFKIDEEKQRERLNGIRRRNEAKLEEFQLEVVQSIYESSEVLNKTVMSAISQSKVETKKHAEDLINEITHFNIEAKEILSQNFKEVEKILVDKLHIYLNEEEEEIQYWIEKVTITESLNEKVQLLETAINKYPMISHFISSYRETLISLFQDSDDKMKKKIIEKLNHAARIHLDNCKPEDWLSAKAIKDETLRMGNQFMKEQENIFIKRTTHILNQLEVLVSENNTEIDLSKVEELDESIDQNILKHYPSLKNRYQLISTKLMEYINKEPSKEGLKAYNKSAIQAFKRVHSKFNQFESTYKMGERLNELSNELGGWEHSLFTTPTQIYFQSVYSDIFAKLSPNAKPKLTELILDTSTKKVN
ncbi:hypothetical protein [Bacillus sp. AK128]